MTVVANSARVFTLLQNVVFNQVQPGSTNKFFTTRDQHDKRTCMFFTTRDQHDRRTYISSIGFVPIEDLNCCIGMKQFFFYPLCITNQ